MSLVVEWTGVEVRHLRMARRMSVREFAAHLGVTDRMISKWEAGGPSIRPRPVNQAVLDESLKRLTLPEVQRFEKAMDSDPASRVQPATRVRWGLVVDLHPHDMRLAERITLAVEKILHQYGAKPTPPE